MGTGAGYKVKDICPYMCDICDINDQCPGAEPNSCLNGGNFSPVSCSCECAYYFEGDQCQTKSECPNKDESYCGGLDAGMCEYWVTGEDYQIAKVCPYMCGICSIEEKCPGADGQCQNGGNFNPESCLCDCPIPYTGDKCETKGECPADASYCGTPQPYGFEEKECEYTNVPPVCPHMCGLC